MALPNGTGGYQLGTGNAGEAQLTVQGAPTPLAVSTTLTPEQLASGLFTVSAAVTLTLPAVATLEAAIPSAQKVDTAFTFAFVCTTGSALLAVGTGWTIVGSGSVNLGVSGRFLARKTGNGAWTLYRIA